MDKSNQLVVKSFEPNLIQVEIVDFDAWKIEHTEQDIKIGSYLKIQDGDDNVILSLVTSFKMVDNGLETGQTNEYMGKFLINTQPIGQLKGVGDKVTFTKGIKDISIPPTIVSIATDDELKTIFSMKCDSPFVFSTHSKNENIDIVLDGDRFFSKHIAVVGTTGSGKSCTVAKIFQEAAKSKHENINNTHVVILDIHGEYEQAFPQANLLRIDDDTLKLPYWLMNAEELEDMFIESNESNSHNQVSQFKNAVIKNKQKHNPSLQVTYDSPVYFSLNEVYNYIKNKNMETYYSQDSKKYYAINGQKHEFENEEVLWGICAFEPTTGNSKNSIFNAKVAKGDFYGEFNRFVSRLETKMQDERLHFLLNEEYTKGIKYTSNNLENIIMNLLGYESKKNITVIDLSSLPFEVISIVVSIISRLLFDFSYYKTRLGSSNTTPYMIVFEEAHKYVPKNKVAKFNNTRIAVERVLKEGRKYGLTGMVVTQRPSELSTTVFSQCNNFIVMRLTNPDDQNYVKRLLPDAVSGFGDSLSSLEQKEALIVGDSVSTPCLCIVNNTNPKPMSEDVKFYTQWQKEWESIVFQNVIKKINKSKPL